MEYDLVERQLDVRKYIVIQTLFLVEWKNSQDHLLDLLNGPPSSWRKECFITNQVAPKGWFIATVSTKVETANQKAES